MDSLLEVFSSHLFRWVRAVFYIAFHLWCIVTYAERLGVVRTVVFSTTLPILYVWTVQLLANVVVLLLSRRVIIQGWNNDDGQDCQDGNICTSGIVGGQDYWDVSDNAGVS